MRKRSEGEGKRGGSLGKLYRKLLHNRWHVHMYISYIRICLVQYHTYIQASHTCKRQEGEKQVSDWVKRINICLVLKKIFFWYLIWNTSRPHEEGEYPLALLAIYEWVSYVITKYSIHNSLLRKSCLVWTCSRCSQRAPQRWKWGEVFFFHVYILYQNKTIERVETPQGYFVYNPQGIYSALCFPGYQIAQSLSRSYKSRYHPDRTAQL